MPSHVILLRVFVGSPGGLEGARQALRRAVDRMNVGFAPDGVYAQVIGWEDVPAGRGEPQERINESLRDCDLLVVLMGQRFGSPTREAPSGTVEEFRVAEELARQGLIDDIKMYFARSLDVDAADREAVEQAQKVDDWRRQLDREKPVYYHRYDDLEDLKERLRFDLEAWLRSWAEIVRPVVTNLLVGQEAADLKNYIRFKPKLEAAEVRLRAWREEVPDCADRFPLLEELAYRCYVGMPRGMSGFLQAWGQERSEAEAAALASPPLFPLAMVPEALLRGPAGAGRPGKPAAAATWLANHFPPEILFVGDGGFTFARPELFWYFIACRLARAIKAGDSAPVRSKEFVNEIHQMLSILVRRDPEASGALRRWLTSWNSISGGEDAIVRNFAAFALGMSQDEAAIDDLFDSVVNDPDRSVRIYAAMALGMLRERRVVPKLLRFSQIVRDDEVRTALHQAILYIKHIIPNPYW